MSEKSQNNINEANLLEAMTSVTDEQIIPDNYIATAGKSLDNPHNIASKNDIIEALKTVCDPEIAINIYDLGLIYKIDILENGDVKIEMTLTAPTCPVAGVLPQQAADAIANIDNVGQVEVKVVWEPAWSIENISQDAKDILEML